MHHLRVGPLLCLISAAACAGSSAPASNPTPPPTTAPPQTGGSQSPPAQPASTKHSRTRVAIVTTELRNRIAVISLPNDRVKRRIAVAADPKTVAAAPGGPVAVVSPGSGTVTLFNRGMRREAVFHHFVSPQLAAFTPDGEYLLVTDAGAGTLTVIELAHRRVTGRVAVGAGAHHLAVSPDGRQVWVALGETATTISVVDVADHRHPRLVRQLHTASTAHDLAFAPDGKAVWVSSSATPYVSVLRASDGRLVARVPAGRAPQHVLFAAGRAYLTSGYGSTIEMVDPHSRAVIKRTTTPYGSFNLAAAGRRIVVTSVLNGMVTVLDAATLRRLHQTRVASAARSVAVLAR